MLGFEISLNDFKVYSDPFYFFLEFIDKKKYKLIEYNNRANICMPSLKTNGKTVNDINEIINFLWEDFDFSLKIFDEKQKTQNLNFENKISDFYKNICEYFNSEFIENLTHINEILEKLNNEYVNFNNYFTPFHFLLFETLNLIDFIDENILKNEKFINLKQFKLKTQFNENLQPFLNNLNRLQRNISPLKQNESLLIINQIKKNIDKFIDFAILNTAAYYYEKTELKNFKYVDHIPFSAFPMKILKTEFDILKKKNLIWNKLLDAMVRKIDIFDNVFENLSKTDDFVRKLFEISKKNRGNKKNNNYFCIFRNDFLKDGISEEWLQVEFNTIAVSFGYMSDSIQKFHKLIFNPYFKDEIDSLKNYKNLYLPQATETLCKGILKAHLLYGNIRAKILFVISENETNILDQRGFELFLAENNVISIRMTFQEILQCIKLDESENKLFIGEHEISVVYFRHGYMPNHYTSEDFWKIREIIESSSAFKCPSADFQLINFKKIQEILQNDSILNQLLPDLSEAKLIKENFANIWGLDTKEDQEKVKKMVSENIFDYVLKPQREGGGNNIYGYDIIETINKLSSFELQSFILMKKIKPIPRLGFLVKKREFVICPVISEIGLYSYIISDNKKIIESEVGGYLLRTKNYKTDEGGVATGYSVLDSFIYEENSLI